MGITEVREVPGQLVFQERQPLAWDSEKEQGSLGITEKTKVTGFAEVGVGLRDRARNKVILSDAGLSKAWGRSRRTPKVL